MEWTDWIFKALVLGVAGSIIVTTIKGYKAKAEAPIPPVQDQAPTWGTLVPRCKEEHQALEDRVMNEMSHFAKEFQKDLERVEKRFDSLTQETRKTNDCLQKINTSLQLLRQEVEKGNNGT